MGSLKIQLLTCHLYGTTASTDEVNELRYQFFWLVETSQLPPCKDCLHTHFLRANYQASIWTCCLKAQPFVADPKECGWTTDDGHLVIEWLRTPAAPDAVLELLSGKCLRSCKLPRCRCQWTGMHQHVQATDVQQSEERRTVRS